MKSTGFALILVLVSAAAFAQSPEEAHAPLATVLAVSSGSPSCAAAPDAGVPAWIPKAACNATANCGTGAPVSCSGSSSCQAVDGCSGYVRCDGVTTSCGSSGPCCTCAMTSNCLACCVCAGGHQHHCVDQCGA
jgi:hypothetical protein